jgi:hypothetical protein
MVRLEFDTSKLTQETTSGIGGSRCFQFSLTEGQFSVYTGSVDFQSEASHALNLNKDLGTLELIEVVRYSSRLPKIIIKTRFTSSNINNKKQSNITNRCPINKHFRP